MLGVRLLDPDSTFCPELKMLPVHGSEQLDTELGTAVGRLLPPIPVPKKRVGDATSNKKRARVLLHATVMESNNLSKYTFLPSELSQFIS